MVLSENHVMGHALFSIVMAPYVRLEDGSSDGDIAVNVCCECLIYLIVILYHRCNSV